jgi:cysteinyl-tRNA synthetase, unknown class
MINAVKSWGYQLQNIKPGKIAGCGHDLVVIDHCDDERPFSPADVTAMRRRPDGSCRLLLAYMSIGEAESYRFYWDKAWCGKNLRRQRPSWLGKENPDWDENYAVKFWEPGWQQVIFDYADRIVAAGFDGVYLDKVDAFEDWSRKGLGHKDAMVDFVASIAARVKAQRPGCLVVSQNGQQLISNARFRNAIDAFAREDLFYGEDEDGERNEAASISDSVAMLKRFAADGKPVFVVEYPRNAEQGRAMRREIAEQGFIGLVARRDLDTLA